MKKKLHRTGSTILLALAPAAALGITAGVIVVNLPKAEAQPIVDPEMSDKVDIEVTTDGRGYTLCTLTAKETTKQVASVAVAKGGVTLEENEYEWNKEGQYVSISPDVMQQYPGQVVIKPTLEEKGGEILEVDWIAACEHANIMHNPDPNMTIEEETSMGGTTKQTIQVANNKCYSQATSSNSNETEESFDEIQDGMDLHLSIIPNTNPTQYRYDVTEDSPIGLASDFIDLMKNNFSQTTHDKQTGLYTGSVTYSEYQVTVNYQASIESKKFVNIVFEIPDYEMSMTLKYSKDGTTTLSHWPDAGLIENNIVDSTYDEATHRWTSATIAKMEPREESGDSKKGLHVFRFDLRDKPLLTNNTIKIYSKDNVLVHSSDPTIDNLNGSQTFAAQAENNVLAGPNRATWSSDGTSFTIDSSKLENKILYIIFGAKTKAAENLYVTFTTSN